MFDELANMFVQWMEQTMKQLVVEYRRQFKIFIQPFKDIIQMCDEIQHLVKEGF